VHNNTTADHAKALFNQWSRQQPLPDHHHFKYLLANPANDKIPTQTSTDEHQPEDMEIRMLTLEMQMITSNQMSSNPKAHKKRPPVLLIE
jgi:2-methylcitrate dehydratase PrpD